MSEHSRIRCVCLTIPNHLTWNRLMIKFIVKLLGQVINAFDAIASPLNSKLAYNRVEGTLRWLIGYPLLFGQILLFMLIAWGVIGGEIGLTDLFWHEASWIQL